MTGNREVALRLAVGTAMFTILFPATAATSAAESPTPCASIDAKVAAGELKTARSLYEALGDVDCARQGIGSVDTLQRASVRLVRQAQDTIAIGTDEAIAEGRKVAALALALDRENAAAKEIANDERPDPLALCKTADKIRLEGDIDTASRLYVAAEKREATKDCAAEGLARIAELRETGVPQRVIGVVTGALKPWLVAALTAALVVLVCSMLVGNLADPRHTSRAWRNPKFRQLVLALLWVFGGCIAVSAGLFVCTALGLSWPPPYEFRLEAFGIALVGATLVFSLLVGTAFITRPRLAFQTFTGTKDLDAVGIAALVSAEFRQMSEGAASGVDQVRNTDLAEAPFVKTFDLVKNPIATTLLSIWKALTPGIDLSLTAHVHATDADGLVAAVSLRHANRNVASGLVSVKSLTGEQNADDLQDLATAIAAWLVMQLGLQSARLYNATQWQGLALTTIAARNAPTDPSVRRLLAKALNHDSRNMAATFALVTARFRQLDGDEQYEQAIQALQGLRDELALPSTRHLPLAWRVEYSYIAAVANRLQLKMRECQKRTPDQTATSRWLLWHKQLAELSSAVDNLKAALVEVAEGTSELPDGLVASDRGLARQLLELTRAAESAVTVTQAAVRPKDQMRSVVDALLQERTASAPRVQFNRACALGAAYSLTRNDHTFGEVRERLLTASIECIQAATEDPHLAAMARTDPYLVDIMSSPEYGRAIDKTPPAFVPDYADLECIGSMAHRLVALGLRTAAELATELSAPEPRNALQLQLGIGDQNQYMLREWQGALSWLAADISAEHINVVQRSGYPDRDSILAVPAGLLEERTFVQHRVLGYEGAAPSIDDLITMGAQANGS